MIRIFAKRLKSLRRQAGVTQKELAATVHVTAATMSNYENGIYLPPLQTAYDIALTLQCSLDYLTGLGEDKYLKEPRVYVVAEEKEE